MNAKEKGERIEWLKRAIAGFERFEEKYTVHGMSKSITTQIEQRREQTDKFRVELAGLTAKGKKAKAPAVDDLANL